MAIPIPVTKTKIATVPWGIPITNEVNRLTLATAVTPWVNVTFLNGWSDVASGLSLTRYRKVGDIVYIIGSVKRVAGFSGLPIFNLPVGFRCLNTMALITNNASSFSLCVTGANGDVSALAGTSMELRTDINVSFPTT